MALLSNLIRYHSRKVMACFAVLAVLAGIGASRLHIDASVERLMIAGDPMRAIDEQAKEEFGNDEILLVGFDLGARFTKSDLVKLSEISGRIAELPEVEKTRDLSNIEDVRGRGDELDASSLVKFDRLDESFADIAKRTQDHRLYDRILVSRDQAAFGMLVYPENHEGDPEALNRMTAAVKEIAAEYASPWGVYYAGYPYIAYEVNRIIKRDLGLLTPLALLGIGLILYVVTRKAYPLLLLLILIAWVELVAHAFLGLSGAPLNVVVSATPTILMATSSAYFIYTIGMMARSSDELDPGVALLELLYRPVLLSAVSTGIGFLSLRSIDVVAIGDLGMALAVGIAAAAVGTLLLMPAIVQEFDLQIWPRRINSLEYWSSVGVRWAARPWLVVAVSALLLAVAIPGATRLTVHTDTLSYFKDDNEVRTGAQFFEDRLSSGFLINVVIRGAEEGRALDPEVLAVADQIREHLGASPNVDRTVSMLDYFHLIDAAVRPDAETSALPDSREAAAQYLLLYEASGDPENYEPYINYDRSALAMVVPMHGGSAVYIDTAREIEELTADRPDDINVDTLGSTYLYSRAMDGLTRGIGEGLIIALLLIGAVMLIGLRSFKLAAVAAIPNVAPLVLIAGGMGWLDIPLAMGTSIVGCVTLGLAVDDTAHVLGHLHRETTLAETYRVVGPPVLLTTIALGIGFAALTLSEFQSVAAFGLATGITLVIALLGDLILLPSLLVLIGYRRSDEESGSPRLRVVKPATDPGDSGRRAA
jgi:predicted RND superfamily exporter protein